MVYYLFSRLYYTTKYLFFQVFFDLTYLTWKKQKIKKNPWHKNKIIVSFFKIKNSRVVAIMIFLQRVFVWWEKAKIVFVNGLDRCRGEIIVAVDGYSRYRVGISATCPYLRWGGFIPRKMAPWDCSRSFTIYR